MDKLLVPVDFSEVTVRVVSAAERLARAFGAKVWLLHCVAESRTVGAMGDVPMFVSLPDEPLPERYPDEHRQLVELASSLRNKGIDVETIFVSGVPIDVILAAADQHLVDLIIVGSHGHGVLYELMVGTVAKFVLLRAGRPTLIIPSGVRETRKLKEMGELEFTRPEFFGLFA